MAQSGYMHRQRFSIEERKTMERAAKAEGYETLSAWIRARLGLAEAAKGRPRKTAPAKK